MTDQIRRSSRSVSGQIAEGEAAETQVWLEYSVKSEYMSREDGERLHRMYDQIIGKLVTMGNNPAKWVLRTK